MVYYTYILQSGKTGRFYVGSCSDVNGRLQRHNAGATLSTKSGRPWEVVYYEVFEGKVEALNREKYLKGMKSRVYLENLINQKEQGPKAG